MKRTCGGTIISIYLLMASVHGIDEGGFRVPISGGRKRCRETPDPSKSTGESLIVNGIQWNLSTDGKSFSPSEIALSKVNCTDEGIFPVIGSCHDYYYCQNLYSKGPEDWYVLWFTCPDEKIFDENSETCLPQSLASGRPECQQEKQELIHEKFYLNNDVLRHALRNQGAGASHQFSRELSVSRDPSDQDVDDYGFSGKIPTTKREKRSVNIVRMVDIVAQSAKETCLDVKNIDNYVKQISSKSPLRFSTNSDGSYKTIIMQHNYNVRTAQRNADRWKGENGILAAIKETYLLTEEFEPKFSERFQRMSKRVAAILESDELKIESLGNELNETKEIIKRTEETLEKTVNKNVNNFVLRKMNRFLRQKKEDHHGLVKEYNEARKETEFQELTEILKYVKNNSLTIQEKVEDTRTKMEDFQQNTFTDSGNFKRTRLLAGNEMKNIRNRKEGNSREISRINANKVNLRRDIAQENSKINALTRWLEASNEEHRREVARLDREASEGRSTEETGRNLLYIPIIGWILGPIFMSEGASQKIAALNQKAAAESHYRWKVQLHRRQVNRLTQQIKSADRTIAYLEATTRSLQRELPNLTRLDNNLQSLKSNVESLLPFITEAIASLERMKEVFLETERDLDKVIVDAGKSHTAAQKRIVSHFMYYVIDSKIKKNWENARDKIISVGECVVTK